MGLPTILMAVGTAFNVVGSLQEGASESSNIQYQAEVNRYNSAEATREGEVSATNTGLQTRAQVGKIKAAQAGSGIDVNSGSAAAIQAAAAGLGELDALTIRSNASRKALGYTLDASNLERGASDVRTASYLKAASSLVGGASSIAKSSGTWKMSGAGSDSFGAGFGTGAQWDEPFDLGFANG